MKEENRIGLIEEKHIITQSQLIMFDRCIKFYNKHPITTHYV